AARPRGAQPRARPRHRDSVPERRARPVLLGHQRPRPQALYELGRLHAAPEASGVADQLHRRLRHPSEHHVGDHHGRQTGGGDGTDPAGVTSKAVTYADRPDFLSSSGTWANDSAVHTAKDFDGVTPTGLGSVDFWIGGLAEEVTPFGGLLGSTFNFVFENQMEKLQDADRFYYLERTAGMNFNAELEANTFSKLVEANTDATHLSGLIFHKPVYTLEVDPTKQFNADVMLPGPDGILGTADDVSAPRADPVN